jgi:transketolase
MLILRTAIGEGLNKKRGSNKIHGAPAGIDEIVYFVQNSEVRSLFENTYGADIVKDDKKLKEKLTNRIKNKEELPIRSESALNFMRENIEHNKLIYNEWKELLSNYEQPNPQKYKELQTLLNFSFSNKLKEELLNFTEEKPNSTRVIAGKVLNLCANYLPQIIGGSADLASSTQAMITPCQYIKNSDFSGKNIAFGIREHSMGAICNGLAANGIHLPFSSTFLAFLDYMKPSVRMAAMMKLNHLFIFSHDSIYIGEDGPTHQAIEQLNSLRVTPDILTFRPVNDIETAFSFLYFFEKLNGPIAIITTRQKILEEAFDKELKKNCIYENFKKGAYTFYEKDSQSQPDLVLGGSGSEVVKAFRTARLIETRDNKKVRVISIPCVELFHESDISYKRKLLGDTSTPFLFIEAASHRGVEFFYSKNIKVIDINSFGKSGPSEKVGDYFGFGEEEIYKECLSLLNKRKKIY